MKIRIALCDALLSPYTKERLRTEWDDEVVTETEKIRLAILNVKEEHLLEHWREWEKVFTGKAFAKVRPIENDPVQAFIDVTF